MSIFEPIPREYRPDDDTYEFESASWEDDVAPPRESFDPRSIWIAGLVLSGIVATGLVVTNLADPSDVWIRLETAFVFPTGEMKNPEVTAAEIREDLVAYARTVKLVQLEGPSALQHLREDLNERVAVRTNGQVNELIIESLIVQ